MINNRTLRRRKNGVSLIGKIGRNFKKFHFFTKRQKFVIGVLILSFGLFFSEHFFGRSGLIFVFLLSLLTDLLILLSIYEDIKETDSLYVFILPFLFSFAFGLFYFLVPARFITRIAITSLYGIGLYSLLLSQNIFVIASMKTIQLLPSARIVSFILTVVSYFFLANIAFSLHLSIIPLSLIIFSFSFLLVFHSLWMYGLDKSARQLAIWSLALAGCLFEASLILWFWPTNPTVIALFLTGFYYSIVGLTHVWFDKRLFKNVLWEYVWVGAIVLFVLILFTSWG